MESVGAYEAKTHLPELLKRVARGERITGSATLAGPSLHHNAALTYNFGEESSIRYC